MPPKAPPVLIPALATAPEREFAVGRQYLVSRGSGQSRPASVLNWRQSKLGATEVYISFVGEDKRLDAWIPASALGDEVAAPGPSREYANDAGPSTPGAQGLALARAASRQPEDSETSTPEREHAAVTRVRNFEDVRFGEYLIKTWYYSPYPMPLDMAAPGSPLALPSDPKRGRKRKAEVASDDAAKVRLALSRSASDLLATGVGKGGEGARGRLWACDLCFKYMRTRAGWDKHTSTCSQMQPPGRRVYQRGSYTIWEVDGAQATLYCQNLSLFGKLFIDHKSIFFHVENFLFYVLCDAATSRRDQVMAFFSKEKMSYDDYNLACIVTFPPFQNRGFGKLLIEFSYYLTRHPATRPVSLSPGTPERPLSDLGHKGYIAYWVAVVLRICRSLLADAEPAPADKAPTSAEGRSMRARKPAVQSKDSTVWFNGVEFVKRADPDHAGQYSVASTATSLAKACHLRADDVQLVLAELGFLKHRRTIPRRTRGAGAAGDRDVDMADDEPELGEWNEVEVVITRDAVDAMWSKWRVKENGILDEQYSLL